MNTIQSLFFIVDGKPVSSHISIIEDAEIPGSIHIFFEACEITFPNSNKQVINIRNAYKYIKAAGNHDDERAAFFREQIPRSWMQCSEGEFLQRYFDRMKRAI